MILASAEISSMIGGYFWPFVRIAALVGATPAFSSSFVPMKVRLGIAIALTMVVAPILDTVPVVDALSGEGFFIILTQMLLGIVMGFVLHLVFTAFILGGQIIAMQMGLGFASMIDPSNGSTAPVLSMLYVLVITLLYFVFNGHLVLIEILVESFRTIPISPYGFNVDGLWQIVTWMGFIFQSAILIALPAVAALFLTNMALGVMSRAAPQLNIFAVGFGLIMVAGFTVMTLSLPNILYQFEQLLEAAFSVVKVFAGQG